MPQRYPPFQEQVLDALDAALSVLSRTEVPASSPDVFDKLSVAQQLLEPLPAGRGAGPEPRPRSGHFFDLCPDPAGIVDDEGRLIHVNDSFTDAFGLSRGDLVGGSFMDLVQDDDRECSARVFEPSLQGEGLTGFRSRGLRSDGKSIWLESHTWTNPATGNVFFIARNVTQRERAREQTANIFELSVDLICVADVSGFILAANPAFSTVLGHDPEQLAGKRYMDLIHPDDRGKVAAAVRVLAQGDSVRDLPIRMLTAEGNYRDLVWNAAASDTGIIYAVGRDESALVEQQTALERTNRLLSDAQRIAKVGDWQFDVRKRSLLWSEEARRIFGTDVSEINPTHDQFVRMIHEDDREMVYHRRLEAIRSNRPVDSIHRIVRSDGSIRTVHERGELMRDEAGNPVLHGTVQDITEREDARRQNEAFIEVQSTLLDMSRRLLHVERERKAAQIAAESASDIDPKTCHVSVWVRREDEWRPLTSLTCGETSISSDRIPALLSRLEPDIGGLLDSEQTSEQLSLTDGSGRLKILPFPFIHEEVGCMVCLDDRSGDDELIVTSGAREWIAVQLGTALRNVRILNDMKELSSRRYEDIEVERRELAKELHDQVGATLTGLSIALDMAKREALAHDTGAPIAEEMENCGAIVKGLMAQIRNVSLQLRPGVLDDFGLSVGLDWLVDDISSRTSLDIDLLNGIETGQRFPTQIETSVFRVVQESLTNVVRYAEVDNASVRVALTNNRLLVRIADKGKGFDAERMEQRNESVGLPGMRERVELAGGQLNIDSQPGRGTIIDAVIPIAPDSVL